MSKLLGCDYTLNGKPFYIYRCDICKGTTTRFRKINSRVICFDCKKAEHKIKYQRSVTV